MSLGYEQPKGIERSAWQILDHMRRTLENLLVYSTHAEGDYQELKWPDDYWSASAGQGYDWDRSRTGLEEAQRKMEGLGLTEDLTKIPWEPSHNLLREAILAIEHATYHAGELVELPRWLNSSQPQ